MRLSPSRQPAWRSLASFTRPRQRRMRSVPEGIRITKVGLWYILFIVIVAIASTNTGNNALYMVLAVMLGVLVTSGLVSRHNVQGLGVELTPPGEVYANRPFHLAFTLTNRGRFLPRWFLLFSASRQGRPLLIPYLKPRSRSQGELEMIEPRRGLHRLQAVHVASLFPFGFFRKGTRYSLDLELLVFPEIFDAPSETRDELGDQGDVPQRRLGWGHDLHALRGFRQGDDPRGVHWKQTARTGRMIYMERESEAGKRLSILFDNGVGKLSKPESKERFERLVSEAATAGVDALDRGYEVELVTRGRVVPFGSGLRQRLALLEVLALVEPEPRRGEALTPSLARVPVLRLSLEPGLSSAPGSRGVSGGSGASYQGVGAA